MQDLLLSPMIIPRNTSVTISDHMRTILPVMVSRFQGNTTPRALGNPVLNFPTLLNRQKTNHLKIFPDEGRNEPAYFDYFHFGQLDANCFEVCYSSSLGSHARLVADFGRKRAYLDRLPLEGGRAFTKPRREEWYIYHFGLLPSGCTVASASLPRFSPLSNNHELHVCDVDGTALPVLKLNSELSALIDAEVTGNGVLLSLKTPGAVFSV
jgi:hypothetical protein